MTPLETFAAAFVKEAVQTDEERRRKDREYQRQRRLVSPAPHQLRVSRKLDHVPGLLLQHGLGSGKGLSSIFAAEHLGVPGVAVVPAALRENYKKELGKAQASQPFRVESYEGFIKRPDASNKLLVVDEGQRMRNPNSLRTKAIQDASRSAFKRLVLSGTPIQNSPEELAPIMNVVAGSKILPEGQAFRNRYIGEKKVWPGLWGIMTGVKPGTREFLRHRRDLARRIRGLVDYHPSTSSDFPSLTADHRDVEMGDQQKAVYDHVLRNMPRSMHHKMERNLPPSKQEAKSLNAFLTAARVVSNTPAPYQDKMTALEGFDRSAKLQAIHSDIAQAIAANPRHKSLVYSNYLSGGVRPLAAALARSGIPHATFTGSLSDGDRKQTVDDFNSGRTKVLLISGAGAEGLDLKGTRAVHIMDPHWNEGRIQQVIGRARRRGSHAHLPEAERTVHVRSYHSIVPRTGMQRLSASLFGRKSESDKRYHSADQYLKSLAQQKQTIIDDFHKVLQDEGSRPE